MVEQAAANEIDTGNVLFNLNTDEKGYDTNSRVSSNIYENVRKFGTPYFCASSKGHLPGDQVKSYDSAATTIKQSGVPAMILSLFGTKVGQMFYDQTLPSSD